MMFEMYEDMLKDIRKYIRDNNLDENDIIYVKRVNDIIINYDFSFNEGYMGEKLGKIILEMEER